MLLQRLQEDLRDPNQREALTTIRREWKNVEAAWHWVLLHGDLISVERAHEAIYLFCEMCGLFARGEVLFRQAVNQLEDRDDGDPSAPLMGKLLIRHGWFLCRLASMPRRAAPCDGDLP
ncbi:MAG: hypothetical protein Q9O62_03500 [Ardenticatenia bacterium]|nr:hypothetical protein [Ardenticatenia bacterium]